MDGTRDPQGVMIERNTVLLSSIVTPPCSVVGSDGAGGCFSGLCGRSTTFLHQQQHNHQQHYTWSREPVLIHWVLPYSSTDALPSL